MVDSDKDFILDYRDLFHSVPDLYLILNPKLQIIDASESYLKATMIKREDVLGRNIFDVFPDNPNDANATGTTNLRISLTTVLQNKIADTMAVQKYDVRKPGKKKFEERYWSPKNIPVLNQKGQIKYIIHRVEDVTKYIKNKKINIEDKQHIEREIYHRSQELQEANKQLRMIQKMKDEFISVVSHELRTPLTSIQGSLALLLGSENENFSEKSKTLLTIGKQNSERLIRLINDILDIEKMEAGKMEFKLQPLSIDAIVEEAIINNQSYGEKFGIKIRLITPPSNVLINADHDRLLQVLANLISNAIKFTEKSHEVLIHVTKKEDQVLVAVTNKGAGIPKQFQNKIFQKFSQVDSSSTRQQGGTGLGLSISKEIIEQLHGTIGFTSEENQETVFYFNLPIMDKLIKTKQISKKTPTVLICEDDIVAAKYLKIFLEPQGFKIFIANDAKTAKQVLNENRIDAMLLDLILPDEDGISLLKKIRKMPKYKNLPIIVVSMDAARGKQDLVNTAFTVLEWIEKPVSLEKLTETVQTIKKMLALHTPNILHVEDDKDLQQIVAHLIQTEANVVSVSNLRQAKSELNKKHYDLIILDLMLPDGNALELLPIITKKHIPIIIFSAYDLPKDYAQYVVKSLVKSKTSQHDLVEIIKNSLTGKTMEENL